MIVALELADQEVLVAGGGNVATRRVQQLLEEGARITVISPELSKELKELHRQGLFRWLPRKLRLDDLKKRWFLIALCISDPARNQEFLERARMQGLWISSAMGKGTVRHLATRERRGFRIAVDSQGKDPAGARALVERLARSLEAQGDPLP